MNFGKLCTSRPKAKSTTAGQQKNETLHHSPKLQCMQSGSTALVSPCSTCSWSDITQVWSMMSHSTEWVQRFNRVVTFTLLVLTLSAHNCQPGCSLRQDQLGAFILHTFVQIRHLIPGDELPTRHCEKWSCHTNDFAVETQLLVVLTHGKNHGVHKGTQSLSPPRRDNFSQTLRIPLAMPALNLKRSSRHTGFCDTPAGMSTRWHP